MQNGINLAKLRSKNNQTINDISKILNVSLSSYKLYETGTIPMSLEEINTLSIFYDVSFDYLLGLSNVTKRDHFRKTIDYKYLKFSIKYLRKVNKINQKNFAKELNYSISSVSRFEHNGKTVSIDYLIKIARRFNISTDYLCGKSYIKNIL